MKTLNDKKEIQKDGIKIIDLAEPTLIPGLNNRNFKLIKAISVTKEYESRPDLLSYVLYDSTDYVDILLKFNEISDPLSIKEGDVILVPEIENAKSFYKQADKENSQVSDNFTDNTKKSKKDEKRIEMLKKISSVVKNGSSVNTKVNELKPGEQNIIEDLNNINI